MIGIKIRPEEIVTLYPIEHRLSKEEKQGRYRVFRMSTLLYLLRAYPKFKTEKMSKHMGFSIGDNPGHILEVLKRRAKISSIDTKEEEPNPQLKYIFDCYAKAFMETDFITSAGMMAGKDACVIRYLINGGPPKGRAPIPRGQKFLKTAAVGGLE